MDLTSLGVILEVSRRKKVLSGLFLFIMTNMVYFIGICVTVSRPYAQHLFETRASEGSSCAGACAVYCW